MSEHGKEAYAFDSTLECLGENCYLTSGNACFLKCKNYVFEKDFTKENLELLQ